MTIIKEVFFGKKREKKGRTSCLFYLKGKKCRFCLLKYPFEKKLFSSKQSNRFLKKK